MDRYLAEGSLGAIRYSPGVRDRRRVHGQRLSVHLEERKAVFDVTDGGAQK